MANPFASIETSINAACLGVLANATAVIGGASVSGTFDANFKDALGVASSRPVFICASTDVSAVTPGASVTINATAFTVRAIEPDGTGMATLILESG